MKIKRVHSILLKNVRLDPIESECFLHDLDLLGVTVKQLEEEFEGQRMLIYTGDFSRFKPAGKCPWCNNNGYNSSWLQVHLRTHNKTLRCVQVLKFQQELYREKLRLLRAGKIDHTYFVYLNWLCQMCDNRTTRGRGLCSVPESARNKTRSLNVFRLKADNFDSFFMKKANIGYIIGKPM